MAGMDSRATDEADPAAAPADRAGGRTGDGQGEGPGDRPGDTPAVGAGRRRLLLGVLPVAVLLGGGAWAWHWWTDPDVFAEGGARLELRRDLDRARPLHLGMTYTPRGEHRMLRVTDAEPVVIENSAEAVFEVRLCTPRPGDGVGGTFGRLERWCSQVREAVGSDLEVRGAPGADYVVLTVTPTTRGVVHVDGLRLSYREGRAGWWRRGTDHVGDELVYRVR